VEISSHFPYSVKGTANNESFLLNKKLPFDFKSKLEEIISKTQRRLNFESKCAKIWLECARNDYNYKIDFYTDEAHFSVFTPIFKVCTDEPALLGEFAEFFENNFTQMCAFFPILNRFQELVKIITSLYLIENITTDQFLINTKNSIIENQFSSCIYDLLPKLPSKYEYKLVYVDKYEYVSEYNSRTQRHETVSKKVSVQEWQNVFDPTNYNRQLALNCRETQIKLKNLFNADISNYKAIESFCENPQAKFDLLNSVVGDIKGKKLRGIEEAITAVKARIDFSHSKIQKEFQNVANEDINAVHIPTGVFNRINNTLIYGGMHIKPNLVFSRGLFKSDREISNSKYFSI